MWGILEFIIAIVITITGFNTTMTDTLSMTDSKKNIEVVKALCNSVYQDKPILAKLAAAQAILESNLSGKPSKLAVEGNNLFGIKREGTDGWINFNTKEQDKKGKESTINAGFGKNLTLGDSVHQHRQLMLNGTKDKPDRYEAVLKATTFEEAAKAIKDCGYATDVSYTKKLIQIYKEYL